MLSSERLREIVTQEVAGPPWDLRFDCINCERARVQGDFQGCAIAHLEDYLNHVWFVQARLWRPDATTGVEDWGEGSKIIIENTMTEGQVVKRCFVAMRDFAEHEVREGFKWKGRRVLSPHIDINAMYDAAVFLEQLEPASQ